MAGQSGTAYVRPAGAPPKRESRAARRPSWILLVLRAIQPSPRHDWAHKPSEGLASIIGGEDGGGGRAGMPPVMTDELATSGAEAACRRATATAHVLCAGPYLDVEFADFFVIY